MKGRKRSVQPNTASLCTAGSLGGAERAAAIAAAANQGLPAPLRPTKELYQEKSLNLTGTHRGTNPTPKFGRYPCTHEAAQPMAASSSRKQQPQCAWCVCEGLQSSLYRLSHPSTASRHHIIPALLEFGVLLGCMFCLSACVPADAWARLYLARGCAAVVHSGVGEHVRCLAS